MTRRDNRARLQDIQDAIAGIKEVTSGLDRDLFQKKWAAQRAVERGLEIISEASRHLSDDLKKTAMEIPWDKIAGIGNVMRHEYQRVDPSMVWAIVTEHLSSLEHAIDKMLEREEGVS